MQESGNENAATPLLVDGKDLLQSIRTSPALIPGSESLRTALFGKLQTSSKLKHQERIEVIYNKKSASMDGPFQATAHALMTQCNNGQSFTSSGETAYSRGGVAPLDSRRNA